MRELLTIIRTERSSLLRGFLVMFLLALPFTFLPTLFRHGLSWGIAVQRAQASLLYAALIAAAIITIALLNNYEKLLQKKRLFELPAFSELNFSGAVEGYNSIIKELSTYLFGRVGDYFFRVEVLHPGKEKLQVAISPMIYLGEDTALLDRLTRELNLQENLYLSRILRLSEEQLQEHNVLRDEIHGLAEELARLKVQPLSIDENLIYLN